LLFFKKLAKVTPNRVVPFVALCEEGCLLIKVKALITLNIEVFLKKVKAHPKMSLS